MIPKRTADSNEITQTHLLHTLDQICDRFEEAWCDGQHPLIEDYIEGLQDPLRTRLLQELVALEVSYRRKSGQTPDASEYESRFTSDTATVREGFDDCSSTAQVETDSLDRTEIPSLYLDIRCPSCNAPMQVAVDTPLTELICNRCGSHFSLVDQSHATQRAPPLSQLGRFELVERLGVGSFGSVWKARDKELDRMVAIKIPRQGMMTTEEKERFFHEARAAAQLQHPNIVSVHEVGSEGESIYIVSDFVHGFTLSDWLTDQKLTGREAAELCAKVAEAVHYAHEQGVIHRDLKPANIMIDGDREPHLMDFGLARRDIGEMTVTIDGQLLGTPAYMSPEQAQGEAHQADRRSDIYSLGVILFQLLTGELPFRGNTRMLIHQVIYDEPPSPRKLNAHVSKDLETITLKCLEKEPAKRYQTAKDVAEELRRYLDGRLIQAKPHGIISKTWRWAHRKPMAASVVAMVVGLAIVGPLVALRQRQLVRAERIATAQVAAEAAKAEAVSTLLLDALQAANPDAARGSDYTVRQLLDNISAKVGHQFTELPEVEAAIRTTMGNAYRRLDLFDDAEAHLTKALKLRRRVFPPDHPEIANSLFANAWLAYGRGDWSRCETLSRDALAIHKKHLLHNEETIEILSQLHFVLVTQRKLNEADQVARELQTMAHQMPNGHPELANVLHRSTFYLMEQGDFGRAEEDGREAVLLHRKFHGNYHPETAWGLLHLSAVLREKGKLDEAEACSREALSIFRTYHDDSHSGNLAAISSLIAVLRAKGDQAELANLRLERVSRAEKALANAESEVEALRLRKADALNVAAWEMVSAKPVDPWVPDQAVAWATEAVALAEEVDSDSLPAYLDTLALAQHLTRATHDAIKTQKRAISLLRGDPTLQVCLIYVHLMQFYHASGNDEEAVTLARDFRDKVIAAYPNDSSLAAAILAKSAHDAIAERLAAPAEILAHKSFQLRRDLFTDDHKDVWFRYNAASMLGEALALQGKFAEAEPLLVESAVWMTTDSRMPTPEETGGEDRAQEAVKRVVQFYQAWHEVEPDAGHKVDVERWMNTEGVLMKTAEAATPTSN
ncbi:serine/threonine-protein kinase [Bythopirellula goksoeyrii]|uniref:non-specific serine/threonine protein kinase n=1 Tax=Bythopirellula goksoeyrii TaxID=1400387 RepID=A0A5B9QPR5_9BACT|nr:serine/threonine-protein kinase [Bythopirellula goksoeyrii]QEG35963.1 Serine/threonine-protein kinase PknB [Bythopirellula goksoeyrii]